MSNFNFKTVGALVKKEFIEHRVAFLYVPGIIIGAVFLTFVLGMTQNGSNWRMRGNFSPDASSGFDLFNTTYAISIIGWLTFILLMLFFYFASSFSADRKNNALLFWKSLPVSDLQIMVAKTLAGLSVFPAMVLAWSLVGAILGFVTLSVASANSSFIAALNSGFSFLTFINLEISALVFVGLALLWYLPLFAAVGLLGTVLRSWAVPAFILILAMIKALEALATLSGGGYFSALIDQRFKEPFNIVFAMLPPTGAFGLMSGTPIDSLASVASFVPAYIWAIDWPGMIAGWFVAALFIYAASQYRRRRLVS
ncbi:ABC transporter, permease protein [hydrothermal vent metagenome]|uniref:ABC transporter, permease protein n=1 Tax=hydrothermal vent metagenome TaxID=652676 RepID=A0A3B0U9W5_9ZZZZ